jgi:hypothetical protein
MDFTKYFSRKIYDRGLEIIEKITLFFGRLNYGMRSFSFTVLFTFGGFWGWLAGFMAMNVTMGLTLSFGISAGTRVAENTEFEHVL